MKQNSVIQDRILLGKMSLEKMAQVCGTICFPVFDDKGQMKLFGSVRKSADNALRQLSKADIDRFTKLIAEEVKKHL